ncbi:MAG: peptidylprolyl isomerase [Candidatus Velthaea sp.]
MKVIPLVATLATAGLCVSLAACSSQSSSGGNIATVNGQAITRAEFDRKLESGPAGKQTLLQLVQAQLVDQYATKNNIAVTSDEVKKREDDIKSKYPPGQFDGMLKQQGLTDDDVHNILRQTIIVEKAVASKVNVSDADVKAYFDKNHASLDTTEQVRARHILVPDLKTANDVEAKLKAGGDFAALAKQYSTDPSTKDKGGELGFFGKGMMVAPFQDAAFADPINKITAPVKSPFGYHIIQVEERKPATKATLANSSAKIRDLLKQQQQGQAVPAFLSGLRADANIVVLDDRLKDAIPPAAPTPAAAPSTK